MNKKLLISLTLFLCSNALAADNPKQTPIIKKTNNATATQSAKKAAKKTTAHADIPIKKETPEEEPGKVAADITNEKFDPKAKQKEVISLVEKGINFIEKNEMKVVSYSFTHTQEFIEGELYLFIFDDKGTVFAHGQQSDLLWSNLLNAKDAFGSTYVKTMLETAQKGGGWVTYEWRGAIKISYIKEFSKDGNDYIIGAGYYSHSKADATVGLVRGATALFNQVIADGRPVEEAFSTLSYPLSERFVLGDLYLYSLDFNGIIRAQGDRPGLIGSSSLDYADSTGKFVNKEIIAQLKEKDFGEGIWVDYLSKNTKKSAYAEKVADAKGNLYFIACGYYPDADRNETVNLVRRGFQFMKASGISAAVREFTDKRINTFRFGDLYLFVYDLKGKCIAHGGNEDFLGQNHFDLQDKDNRFYIREFITQAKSGGGWVDFKISNSFQSAYVEQIDMGVEQFVIGTGMYPVSKEDTASLLVKSAIGYLTSHTKEETFEKIIKPGAGFMRGDLFIFVVDQDAYCYAWGDNYKLIWNNLLEWKDETDKPFIKTIINTAHNGAGKLAYKMNKRPHITYFEQIVKDGTTYVLGSGFYN